MVILKLSEAGNCTQAYGSISNALISLAGIPRFLFEKLVYESIRELSAKTDFLNIEQIKENGFSTFLDVEINDNLLSIKAFI